MRARVAACDAKHAPLSGAESEAIQAAPMALF
jgi:hypothetical protein